MSLTHTPPSHLHEDVPASQPNNWRLGEPSDQRHLRSLRLVWSEEVSADGVAGLLGEDNDKIGETSIAEAVSLGVPFFVQTLADHVLAWEVDDPTLLPVALGFYEDLEQAGRSPVLVASGQDGHHHLWLRETDPEVRGPIRARAERVGLARRRGRSEEKRSMRPPLAPHRLELPTALVRPASPHAVRDRLCTDPADPQALPPEWLALTQQHEDDAGPKL